MALMLETDVIIPIALPDFNDTKTIITQDILEHIQCLKFIRLQLKDIDKVNVILNLHLLVDAN